MARKKGATIIRKALREKSTLLPLVVDGLGAMRPQDRDRIAQEIRNHFSDSLDIDSAFKKGNEQEHRWDYLLGYTATGQVVAVEPHSAKDDEVAAIVKKRLAARQHLQDHLRDGARIAAWLWVASGKVKFAGTEKIRRLLDQNGIQFVGTVVREKHLR